jgi:hypothetical protein
LQGAPTDPGAGVHDDPVQRLPPGNSLASWTNSVDSETMKLYYAKLAVVLCACGETVVMSG